MTAALAGVVDFDFAVSGATFWLGGAVCAAAAKPEIRQIEKSVRAFMAVLYFFAGVAGAFAWGSRLKKVVVLQLTTTLSIGAY